MTRTVFHSSPGAFFLPTGLEDLAGYPLYLIVAAWGLRKGGVLTSVMVSRNFFISQGRARDILHYISHEGQSRIICERVPVLDGTHPFCKGLRIIDINIEDITLSNKEKTYKDCIENKSTSMILPQSLSVGDFRDSARDLRRWMVSRRNGEKVPELLLDNLWSGTANRTQTD